MATRKTEDAFSLSFDPTKFADGFREFAEKGAAQSKDAYAKMKTADREGSEDRRSDARERPVRHRRTRPQGHRRAAAPMPRARSRTWKRCSASGRSPSSSTCRPPFIRKQAELAVEQAKTMQEATRKVAENVAKPGKDAAEKAMSSLKKGSLAAPYRSDSESKDRVACHPVFLLDNLNLRLANRCE